MAKVLYIDDDKEQINLYSFAFHTYEPDIELLSENDPGNAMVRVLDSKPDLILLDILMPIDGIEVLKNLKSNQETSSIPVIVFTNSSQHNLARICEELGAKDVWIKSAMVPKEVVGKVKEILSK